MTDEKANNKLVKKTHEIIFSLSSKENLALFQMASAGVRYNSFLLERLGISRKQYYKGLRALKDAGLIRKFGKRYFHTTLGRLVYREILRIERYVSHLNEMSDFIKKVSDRE